MNNNWNRGQKKQKKAELGITALAAVLLTASVSAQDTVKPITKEKASKSETVYVITDAEGNSREIIVGDWLKNTTGLELLYDQSDLINIENMEGEEAFSEEGDNLIWQANGSDIHYQGTTEKELPVTVKITYYLDGQQIAPQELAGKSGKVTIRLDYTNRESRQGEKGENIYVPFTVMSGMIFTDGCVKNVEVSSGKVITKDNTTVVVGVAFPGLKDSLKIEHDEEEQNFEIDMDIPDYVEITMDAENFELETSASLIISDMFSTLDLDNEEDWQDMKDALDELSDGAKELVDGSVELADGVGELQEKIPELTDGVSELKDGVAEYTDGVSEASSGVDELKTGSSKLSGKTDSLTSGASKVDKGAGKLKSGLNTLQNKTGSFGEGAGTMAAGVQSLEDGTKELTKGLETVSTTLEELQSSLSGDDETKGLAEQLQTALEQLRTAVGSEDSEDYSIRNCYEQMQQDVSVLYNFYNGSVPTSETLAETSGVNVTGNATGNATGSGNNTADVDTSAIEELKAAAAEEKTSAQSAASQAAGAADGAQNNLLEAQNAASLANGQYQDAVNAYAPLLSDIKNTLNTIGLSKYAGYTDDGQSTAQSVADQYQSAAGNYEMAASGYQKSAESYEAAMESYEQTIADYEAIIAQYEAILADNTVQTSSQAISESMISAQQEETTTKQVQAAWTDLFTNLQILHVIEGGDGQQNPGVTASLQNLEDSLIGQKGALSQLKVVIDQLLAGVGSTDTADEKTLLGGARALEAGSEALNGGTEALMQGMGSLTTGVQSLVSGAEELKKGTNQLSSGAGAFADGVSELDQGVAKLQSGMSELNGNSSKLLDGTTELYDGATELADGVDELKDGADELKDGMEELNEDGIKKLKEIFVDDMDQLIDRLQAVQKAGNDYQSFAGIADGMEGDVKFIIKTDSIHMESE